MNRRGPSGGSGSPGGTSTARVFLPGQSRNAHPGIHMPQSLLIGIVAVGNEHDSGMSGSSMEPRPMLLIVVVWTGAAKKLIEILQQVPDITSRGGEPAQRFPDRLSSPPVQP